MVFHISKGTHGDDNGHELENGVEWFVVALLLTKSSASSAFPHAKSTTLETSLIKCFSFGTSETSFHMRSNRFQPQPMYTFCCSSKA